MKLQQSLGNLSAILGNILLPKMIAVTNSVGKIIFSFNEFIQNNKWVGGVIVKLTTVLSILISGFASYRIIAFANSILGLSKVFTILRSAITAVSIGIRLLTAFMMANPIISTITAIAVGAYLIIANWETLKSWFASFFEWFENSAVYKFFKTGIDKIKSFFDGDSELKIDNSSLETVKQHTNQTPQGKQSIENRQQYNITVNSHSANPSDVGSEVMRELNKSMVGN